MTPSPPQPSGILSMGLQLTPMVFSPVLLKKAHYHGMQAAWARPRENQRRPPLLSFLVRRF